MIGANVASEIARGLFSEGTIGCRDLSRGLEIKRLLEVCASRAAPAPLSPSPPASQSARTQYCTSPRCHQSLLPLLYYSSRVHSIFQSSTLIRTISHPQPVSSRLAEPSPLLLFVSSNGAEHSLELKCCCNTVITPSLSSPFSFELLFRRTSTLYCIQYVLYNTLIHFTLYRTPEAAATELNCRNLRVRAPLMRMTLVSTVCMYTAYECECIADCSEHN